MENNFTLRAYGGRYQLQISFARYSFGNGIARPTGRFGYSGYCTYPLFVLTPEWRELANNLKKQFTKPLFCDIIYLQKD